MVTREECLDIIEGKVDFLKNKTEHLFLELYTKIKYQQLQPKSIVDYKREAFYIRQKMSG